MASRGQTVKGCIVIPNVSLFPASRHLSDFAAYSSKDGGTY